MIHYQSAPLVLLCCLSLLVLSGLVTLVWGRKIPRFGDWLVGAFLALLVGALIFSGKGLVDDDVSSKLWSRGWIWPVGSDGAVMIGVLQEALGLIMAGLIAIVSAILLGNQGSLADQPRKERVFSAIAFGAAGVSLCWISQTPWLSFIGLSLVIFSGFLAQGTRWSSNEEAALAIRFGLHRSIGLLMAILGACGLSGARKALVWSVSASGETIPWMTAGQSLSVTETIGVVLLVLGLCVQLNPFPFLGWAVTPSKTCAWVRASLTQIFPALAVFPILFRLQEQLGPSPVFAIFGGMLVASTVLAVVSGLFQPKWEQAFGAWLSAGATLGGAILFFVGAFGALSFLIAFALGSIAFASFQTVLAERKAAESSGGRRVTWVKTGGFLAICASTGVFGFVSAGGGIRWVVSCWHDPLLAAMALVSFALFAALGWKLAWRMGKGRFSCEAHWVSILLPYILILLGLGILWTGTVSGGALPGGVDRVAFPLFDLFFRGTEPPLDESSFVSASSAYWGVLTLAIAAAYWASTQVRRPADAETSFGHRVVKFVVSGYGADVAMGRSIEGLTWLAARVRDGLDRRVWTEWAPAGASGAIRRIARVIARADFLIAHESGRFLRHAIDGPAKFLQLVQNGDVQWYLIFALGSGFAILVHFLWRVA